MVLIKYLSLSNLTLKYMHSLLKPQNLFLNNFSLHNPFKKFTLFIKEILSKTNEEKNLEKHTLLMNDFEGEKIKQQGRLNFVGLFFFFFF